MSQFWKVVPCFLLGAVFALFAQPPGAPQSAGQGRGGRGPGFGVPQGPAPSFADIDYAPADPPRSNGHKLDLYIPAGSGDHPFNLGRLQRGEPHAVYANLEDGDRVSG